MGSLLSGIVKISSAVGSGFRSAGAAVRSGAVKAGTGLKTGAVASAKWAGRNPMTVGGAGLAATMLVPFAIPSGGTDAAPEYQPADMSQIDPNAGSTTRNLLVPLCSSCSSLSISLVFFLMLILAISM